MKNLKTKKTAQRKAFAIVLAIGAMAFMVLLTLTLSAIISSNLRILNAQKQTHEARSHALLGMSIAISNLQRTVGKDNAITVQSAIFDSDPETVRIDNVATPYVVGTFNVKKNASGMSPRDLQNEQRDLVETIRNGGTSPEVSWLISSQSRLRNPISESPENLSDETVTLSEYNMLTGYPSRYGGEISSRLKSEKVEVKAGKVFFNADQGQSSQGAYAWWVSDESQKAKINLTRPEKYLDKTIYDASDLTNQAPSDARVPQVINTSFINELANLNINPFALGYDEEQSKSLAKISTLDELSIVDNSLGEWARQNKGDYTSVSIGLPVDVTQGRLKEDLSVYLYTGKGLSDNHPIIRGSGKSSDKDYTGVNFGLRSYDKHLPTFGILRSFATLALDKPSFQSGVNPQAYVINQNVSQNTHGVYPIIESAEWMLFPSYEVVSGADKLFSMNPSQLSGATLRLNHILYLRVVMRNPFNIKINQSNYVLRLAMPMAMYLSDNAEIPEIRTRWVRYSRAGDNPSKPLVRDNVNKYYAVFKCTSRTNTTSVPNFGDFLEDAMDNNMPAINFNIRNLILLPGESVELRPAYNTENQNTLSTAKVSSLTTNQNVLTPGKIQVQDGYANPWTINSGMCFKLPSDLLFTYDQSRSNAPDNIFEFVQNGHTLERKNEDGKIMEKFVPFVEDSMFLNAQVSGNDYPGSQLDSDAFNNFPLFEVTETTLNGNLCPYRYQTKDIPASRGAGGERKGRSYNRNAFELLSRSNGLKRVWKHDLTEWESATSMNPSTYNSDSSGGRDATHHFYRQDNNRMTPDLYNNWFSGQYDKFIGIIQHSSRFFNHSVQLGEASGKEIPLFYRKDTFGIHKNNVLDYSTTVFTVRLPNWEKIYNTLFSAYNFRCPQLIDSGYSDSQHVIRRSTANQTVGMMDCGSASRTASNFLGRRTSGGVEGYHTWSNTSTIPNIMASSNTTLRNNYVSSHFGLLSPLSGTRRYNYDGTIYAPFDFPRKESDMMNLAYFRFANLSPMPWQPTYAFAESYASPFIRRQNVVEFNKGNELNNAPGDYIYDNEMIDISYLLNASMWDRFFLFTIPQTDSLQPTAGMRLPNTRLFLASIPEDVSDLRNSETAFEEAASHVGIDGAFNVNSTSYEAWRSILGGMLGVKRRTLTNTTINSNGNDPSDSDKFKMPNPGDLNPLTHPEENKEYSYIDLSVGRRISESEIDMLAREIVAEVKRRAPFFSLADFVNRRLDEYSQGEKDENYLTMMGTLAAAIRRGEHIRNRPQEFFNDKTLEKYFPTGDNLYEGAHGSYAKHVSAYDDVDRGRSHPRDVGEQVREYRQQEYMDSALQVPHNEINAHAFRTRGTRGFLNQADLLSEIGSCITVRGDTFIVRAYGESKNSLMGNTSRAYCEAVVQRTSEPARSGDDKVAPESEFGRKFKIVSFKWITPAEL